MLLPEDENSGKENMMPGPVIMGLSHWLVICKTGVNTECKDQRVKTPGKYMPNMSWHTPYPYASTKQGFL